MIVKGDLFVGDHQVGGGGKKKGVEDEYCRITLYICMKIEQ
jgi:hypothetical protein